MTQQFDKTTRVMKRDSVTESTERERERKSGASLRHATEPLDSARRGHTAFARRTSTHLQIIKYVKY